MAESGSSGNATQANRSLAVATALDDDVLLIRRIEGGERLGRMFAYEVEMLSERNDLVFEKLLGTPLTVRLNVGKDSSKTRYINGVIVAFSQAGAQQGMYVYRATVAPSVWRLTRTSDCRIFSKQTAPDIVMSVIRDHGSIEIEDLLKGKYEELEHCVQYRETDFNFISRLMEQEGIYYYFKHDNGSHKIVLCDDLGAHDLLPDAPTIPYYPPGGAYRDEEHVRSWSVSKTIQPGAYVLNDFDYLNPTSSRIAKSMVRREHEQADLEMYDYPGEYVKTTAGERYAAVRIRESQCRHEVVRGAGDVQGLLTGGRFKLTQPSESSLRPDQEREYLVIETNIAAEQDPYGSGSAAGELFTVSFTAIPANEQFRPERTTPKPTIAGPQTAIVVGKIGDEVTTDDYGRVFVQFHWDRYSRANETSSLPVRVSQNWAGKRWGAFFCPRIGQEVIVEFLEGDPDRPIITGRVYNGGNRPPYDPKQFPTMSTIKTNSSKGGGGFNELRFEDKKGSEQIFIHAEKDLHVRVKNETRTINASDTHCTVETNQHELIKGDRHAHVKGDRNETIDGDASSEASNVHVKAKTLVAVEGGQEVHIKGGMSTIVEAGTELTLKVGGNFVVINSGGVFIKGSMVMINSGGSAGSGSGCSPTAATDAQEPDEAEPGETEEPPPAPEPPKPQTWSPRAKALKNAAKTGSVFCEECEKARKEQEQQQQQQQQGGGGGMEEDELQM